MSKAYVVKANNYIRVEPYGKDSIYVLAKLRLPKGNYLISAKAMISAPDIKYDNYFQNIIAVSLACNGRNETVYGNMNHPTVTRGMVILNLPIKLEFDSEVNLKGMALYRPVGVNDAQITALSVDELNISTGNTSNISGERIHFHWFNEENGDPFVGTDYMDLREDINLDAFRQLSEKYFTKINRTWFGRIIDWLSWTNP